MTSKEVRISCLFAILVTLGMFSAAPPASAASRIGGPYPPPPDMPPPAPRGFLLVEEGLWTQLQDQPAGEFEAARIALGRKDIPAAAASVRRAAAYVRAEGSRADTRSREELQAISTELNDLAARLESALMNEIDPLGPVFTRALHMTARHHLALVRLAVADNDTRRTGEQLASAVANVRAEHQWAAQELDPDTAKVLDQIDDLAKLLQGGGASLDESVDKALVDIERVMKT